MEVTLKLDEVIFSFRKIQGGGPIKFDEEVSHLTSSTSRDPTLIAKADGPKIEGKSHPTDRIIKA